MMCARKILDGSTRMDVLLSRLMMLIWWSKPSWSPAGTQTHVWKVEETATGEECHILDKALDVHVTDMTVAELYDTM